MSSHSQPAFVSRACTLFLSMSLACIKSAQFSHIFCMAATHLYGCDISLYQGVLRQWLHEQSPHWSWHIVLQSFRPWIRYYECIWRFACRRCLTMAGLEWCCTELAGWLWKLVRMKLSLKKDTKINWRCKAIIIVLALYGRDKLGFVHGCEE